MKAEHLKLIKAVNRWQVSPVMHPLTCGIDSKHPLLIPTVEDDSVVLVCPEETCDYTQLLSRTPLADLVLSSTQNIVPKEFRVNVTCRCGGHLHTYDTRSHYECCTKCGTLTEYMSVPIADL